MVARAYQRLRGKVKHNVGSLDRREHAVGVGDVAGLGPIMARMMPEDMGAPKGYRPRRPVLASGSGVLFPNIRGSVKNPP